MNILHIITGLGIGGAERVVLDLSTESRRQGHVIHIIFLSNTDDLVPQFKKIDMIPVLYDFSNPRFFLPNVYHIIGFIKKHQIDTVHLHLAHPILLSPCIFLFTRTKIVFTSHNFNIGSKFRELYVWLFKPFRHADILFSESQYRPFYKKQFRVIKNGIAIEHYRLNIPKNDVFTFISVGRLMKVKNQLFLVELMYKMIYQYKKECRLLIAGDGELRNEMADKIRTSNLENHVELLGVRNDINVLMAQSHCLLLPSLWEGLPIVLLEAGASRLPVISNNVGSIPTLLDKENSYICGLHEFEENMLHVMDNYDDACNKADVLFQKIERDYSLESVAKKHIELYASLVKS
jgi:glycosyltransferase involved in cell wall biosynthesis